MELQHQQLTNIEIEKDAILVENNAQTIFDHLNDLEKDKKVYSKRWFWELLQNAKDAVENFCTVEVKVILAGNKLSFCHTGDPFHINDVLHLIFHGSSKKSREGKTGRFGTGFMTTHLLSRKVTISGKLDDGNHFEFELNREAESVGQMKTNLDQSFNDFKKSVTELPYNTPPFNTIFTYDLNDIKIAEEGIQQLKKILPFVMAFNEKIDKIDIQTELETISTKRGIAEITVSSDYKLISQEILTDNVKNLVVMTKTTDSDVAVILSHNGNNYEVINLDESYPKLFFDFPLFGTEKLGCPFVVNSTKFDLKAERDGIYLGEDNITTIVENKRILKKAIGLISPVINILSGQQTNKIFNLFKVKNPFEYTWLDQQWLEEVYQEAISKLLKTPCYFKGESSLTLENLSIPYSRRIHSKSFYDLVLSIKSESTPSFEEIEEWTNVANGFAKLENKSVDELSFVIDEKKLCLIIENENNLKNLNSLFSELGEDGHFKLSINWLNNFYNLLHKDQLEFLTSEFEITPNQKNTFKTRDVSTPYIDNIYSETLKNVAENFDWDIKSELIHEDIVISKDVFPTLTLENAILRVSKLSDSITEENLDKLSHREALIKLLKWFIDNHKINLAKDTFVIVEKGRESNEPTYSKRKLFQSNSDKLLAPAKTWNENFSIYKDLVLKKFILIDDYAEVLTPEDLEFLRSQDIIFTSPLVVKSAPTKNDLKLLVKNPDDYLKLLTDKDELIDLNFEYSDIAYLTRSDDGILIKTGDSFKSAKMLLKFLMSQVLKQDNLFNQFEEVKVGEEIIPINKCLWVSRLRETQWLPVKSSDGEKQSNNERPSVSNITELIKDETEILNEIKAKNSALFFNLLGLSVADILRNILTDDNEKLQWDMTFSSLLTHGNIDPALAVEMLGDPRLQEVYEKQKKEKAQIQKNQQIGYLFEALFKKLMESEEYEKLGLTIKRTGIGSDYGVAVFENDLVDKNNNEVLFELGHVLIELKATGKDFAEMTTTQVEMAASNSDRFVLAVLPLKNCKEAIDQDDITEHARFVINIGDKLDKNYKGYKSYTDKREEVIAEKDGIKLSIEEGKIRYQVQSEIWEVESGVDNKAILTFSEFIPWLISEKAI